ncbi:MAG: hypothetical protein RI568_06060 [Natronomonas sp.]|jgi:hypothetical protein|uniref:hypothetical protein n=1 Tax=Natronomonas sp. TaxID=2184060 RepID=UPI00287095B7|nr:hypothetical protein [Natronomonas sp.]MDR9430250.1 hypothetical protein [Natronomonas sp.]
MVELLELAWGIGFGLFIGAFFGFVLARGDILFAGVGAVVLAAVTVIYAFTLGRSSDLGSTRPNAH